MAKDITSANASATLVVNLFPAGVKLEQFSADGAWSQDGYSVLEMQACGCPVITTDIRALPEMNNEKCGWLIRVPKHPSTEAVYETNEDLENLKKTVRQGIDSILHEIMEEPEKIRYKGKCCIDRIRACHSPQKYECFLSELYENAAQTS